MDHTTHLHTCALANRRCLDLADARELQGPRVVNGDAKGYRAAIQMHAEAPGVRLDDTGECGAAGEPRLWGFASDEVEAWG